MTKLLLGTLVLVLSGCGAAADGGEDGTAGTSPPAATQGTDGQGEVEVGKTSQPFLIVDTTGVGGCAHTCPVLRWICTEWEYDQYRNPVRCLQWESYIDTVCC